MNKYMIVSAILFLTLIVLTGITAARTNIEQTQSEVILSTVDGGCSPDGFMQCETITSGCRHRTCRDGSYQAWASFGRSYACGTNTADGGGQKCIHQKSTTALCEIGICGQVFTEEPGDSTDGPTG